MVVWKNIFPTRVGMVVWKNIFPTRLSMVVVVEETRLKLHCVSSVVKIAFECEHNFQVR